MSADKTPDKTTEKTPATDVNPDAPETLNDLLPKDARTEANKDVKGGINYTKIEF